MKKRESNKSIDDETDIKVLRDRLKTCNSAYVAERARSEHYKSKVAEIERAISFSSITREEVDHKMEAAGG